MPFNYPQPQPNPYVASISDLMLRQGDLAGAPGLIAAQGQVAQANIGAQNLGNLAHIAENLPVQLQQAEAAKQKATLNDLAIKQATEADAAHTGFLDALKNSPRIPIEAGGPFNVADISKSMADRGLDPTVAAKGLEDLNGSFQKAELAKIALIQHGAASLNASGNDPILAGHFIDTLEQTGMYSKDQLSYYRDQAKTTEGVAKLTKMWIGPQAPIKGGPGDVFFDPTTHQPIPGMSVPEKPTKESLAAIIADPNATPDAKKRAQDTLANMGDYQQIADDRRYEGIVQQQKLGHQPSPEDAAWASAHEQMKGLAAPSLFQGAGGTVYQIPKTGGAAVPVPGVQQKPEQEFVTRNGKVIPIPKGTAVAGDIPYAPSQNEVAQQSKLETQYRQALEKPMSNRSGGLGLEDQKVNQALHLLSIFDQNKDPKTGEYTIPKVLQTELAIGLARLISPTGVAAESTIKELNQRTAKGDLAGIVTYLTGTPVTGNTQDVFQMFKDSIERQGSVAQSNRETYLDAIRALAPTDLEDARRIKMEQALKLNQMPAKKPYDPSSGQPPSKGDTMQKYGATYKWDGSGWAKQP